MPWTLVPALDQYPITRHNPLQYDYHPLVPSYFSVPQVGRNMNIKFSDEIWLLRIQLLWIMYTLVYIFFGVYYHNAAISSLLITIGAALITMLMLHNFIEDNTNKITNTLYIALVSWAFLIEKSISDHKDYIGGVFAIVFSSLVGWILWMRQDNPKKRHLQYTIFIVMLTAVICSLVQLIVNVSIKFIDEELIPRSAYYIVGYHGFGTAVAIIGSLWYGSRLLPVIFPRIHTMNGELDTKIPCIALFLILVTGVFYGNQTRIHSNFEDAAWLFSMAYSLLFVFFLIFSIFVVLQFDNTFKVSTLFLLLGIFYPISTSFLSAILIWYNSELSHEQNFVVRWLVFEYVPSFTFGVAFLASVIFGRNLCMHMTRVESRINT